jgi:hypothetical protein
MSVKGHLGWVHHWTLEPNDPVARAVAFRELGISVARLTEEAEALVQRWFQNVALATVSLRKILEVRENGGFVTVAGYVFHVAVRKLKVRGKGEVSPSNMCA